MSSIVRGKQRGAEQTGLPFCLDAILNALPDPLMVIDEQDHIRFANSAAEQFFAAGAAVLAREGLAAMAPFDSPLFALIDQVRQRGQTVAEYGVGLESPRMGSHIADIQVARFPEAPGFLLISLRRQSMAQKIEHQLLHRGAARSVSGMAAVLAHEIKNPLSGIKGAAQLIAQTVEPAERPLTTLICDEADRICALVDRMEVFNDQLATRGPVNIHEVLDHVRRLAEAGFARAHSFSEQYDPSLPDVPGARDALVQVFLNLVKNAAEAAPEGEIILTTAYRHGVKLSIPGTAERFDLPLEICVIDHGPGVVEDLRDHLFDPFVTTRPEGTGLGLALVAKIISDHGGIVECDSVPGRTVFRVLLPAWKAEEGT